MNMNTKDFKMKFFHSMIRKILSIFPRVILSISFIMMILYSCEKDSNPNSGIENVKLTVKHGYRFANAYYDSLLPNANVGLVHIDDAPLARSVHVYDNYYSFEELKGLIRYDSFSNNEGIATFTGVRPGKYYPLVYMDNQHYHLVCTYIHMPGSNFYLDVTNDSIINREVISSSLQLRDHYSGIQATIFWREGNQWNPGDTSYVDGANVALLTSRPESVAEAKTRAISIEQTDASGVVIFANLESPYETYYLMVYYNENDYDIPTDAYHGIYPGFNKDANHMLEVDEYELGIVN